MLDFFFFNAFIVFVNFDFYFTYFYPALLGIKKNNKYKMVLLY